MKLNIQRAENSEQLVAALERLDISVPGRTSGRTTEHTERWVMARLLATLVQEGCLAYPLSVTHRDRPDFLLQSASAQIGVEVSEAISKQYAAYCALAEREFPEVFLEPAHFRWGQPDMSADEMRELLRQSQLSTDGWIGRSAETEWALFLESVIDVKLRKLSHPGFSEFPRNWLAIYDNLPIPCMNLQGAISMLKPFLQAVWFKNPNFDTVFIEHGPIIAKICMRSSKHLILNDLWS